MNLRKGRRPGTSSTRKAILKAAQRLFSEKGYDGVSVRQIAGQAKVDPAMINHHFGSKEQLFIACLDVPLDPKAHITEVFPGPREDLPERILNRFITLWDSPTGTAAAAILRTSVQHEWSAKLMREFILRRAMGPIAEFLDLPPEEARWRINLLASQFLGMIMVRHILKIEPMASAPRAEIVAALAPTVARYLFAPLHELKAETDQP
jgi:AcrR family transcriptional regulator